MAAPVPADGPASFAEFLMELSVTGVLDLNEIPSIVDASEIRDHLDEFGMLALLVHCEECCGQPFPLDLIASLVTFGDVFYYVATKSGHR